MTHLFFKKKLYEYICAKNYIRTHRQARWCPNPNCKKAIFSSSDVTTAHNVTCECGCKVFFFFFFIYIKKKKFKIFNSFVFHVEINAIHP